MNGVTIAWRRAAAPPLALDASVETSASAEASSDRSARRVGGTSRRDEHRFSPGTGTSSEKGELKLNGDRA
jgi:hypothetical protein